MINIQVVARNVFIQAENTVCPLVIFKRSPKAIFLALDKAIPNSYVKWSVLVPRDLMKGLAE